LAKVYRDRVENLEVVFRDPERGREAFELIRRLIDEIRLVPAGGELSIKLKGELAGILALAGAKQSFGSTQDHALQMSGPRHG